MDRTPRLTSITGVARALLSTMGAAEGVGILVSQFGWDSAFLALAQIDTAEAQAALWLAVEQLCLDAV